MNWVGIGPRYPGIEAGRRRVLAGELKADSLNFTGVNALWLMGESGEDEMGDGAKLAARHLDKPGDEDTDRLRLLIGSLNPGNDAIAEHQMLG